MEGQRCNARITVSSCVQSKCPLCKRSFPLVSVLMAAQGLGAEELALAVVAGEDSPGVGPGKGLRFAAAFACARQRDDRRRCGICIEGEGEVEGDGCVLLAGGRRRRLLGPHVRSHLTADFKDFYRCFCVGTVHV